MQSHWFHLLVRGALFVLVLFGTAFFVAESLNTISGWIAGGKVTIWGGLYIVLATVLLAGGIGAAIRGTSQ